MTKALQALIISTLLCVVVGCGKQELTNVEFGNNNQILFIGNGDEPQGLDPHTTTGMPDFHVISALFEGLTSLHPKTLEPQPAIAESWKISDNKLDYTFSIRSNARWSNGDSLTAHDIVYSWERALTPNMANPYAYMMHYIKNAESFNVGKLTNFKHVGVKAIDDKTLLVTLTNPTPFFLELLDHHTYYPVHPPTIKKHGDMTDRNSQWTLPENMVNSAPFTLKRWEINSVIEVVKNPLYWDAENVKLNAIHFLPITDQQAEERAFRSGQIHLTDTPQMAIEKIATYEKKSPELLQKYAVYSNYFYSINTTRKPFDDIRVRKAFSYAIDREALVKHITKGGEVPAFNFVPPDSSGHKPNAHFSYDPEQARALLSEAGYPNGEGVPSFDILYNTHDNHRKVALAIQQMWQDTLNVKANLVNQEWKVFLDTQHNMHYDISRFGWVADYRDPSNFYELLLSYGGNNYTGWKNEDYDTAILAAQSEPNTAARYALFEQANKLIVDEMPIIPLYFMVDLNYVQPNVKNWHPNVLHRHPFKSVYLATPQPASE
ncbi:peptide ABC transporter substrate-binding protein [Teredinibacter purpureus]|uniref:peptide ABC transporter substrate-binding protein n=1 Tax=Teredinibacter purpureus TaxID=2731756 RepID=UPI0005F88ECD|nr:peptide ABC transporter substrate-binding protein [Teredinibacter purpureus]